MGVGRRFSGSPVAGRELTGGGPRGSEDGDAGQRVVGRLGLELARVDDAGYDEYDDRETEGGEEDVHPDFQGRHVRPSVVPDTDAAHSP